MGDEDITKIVTEGSLPLDLEDKTTEPRLPIGIIPEKQPTLKDRAVEIAKEHPGKVIVAGVMVLALGGALLGGGGEPKGEPPHVQVAISELFKNPVRFSGGPLKVGAEKITTVFGDSVIYESIPQEATCSVVFEAKEKKVGSVSNPVLTFPVWWMSPGSFPLLVQGSSAGGLALWWATFQGNGCLAIADRLEYIGSDIHQLIQHPRGRQLLVKGAKDETWFPHALAGRDDLNYVKADGVYPRKRREQQ